MFSIKISKISKSSNLKKVQTQKMFPNKKSSNFKIVQIPKKFKFKKVRKFKSSEKTDRQNQKTGGKKPVKPEKNRKEQKNLKKKKKTKKDAALADGPAQLHHALSGAPARSRIERRIGITVSGSACSALSSL
jgi:hypothetical protein